MVHVNKCPCKHGRGKPTIEFYKIVDGKKKPQIYCYGWIDSYNDEPLECCKNCLDWVYGEQCEKDFEKYKAESEIQETETWNGIHAQITAPKGTFDKIWEEAESEDKS